MEATSSTFPKIKIFDALDCLAATCSHIPNHGEQMGRYHGYYSTFSRELCQKENKDALLLLPNINILFDPSHMTLGQIVYFE